MKPTPRPHSRPTAAALPASMGPVGLLALGLLWSAQSQAKSSLQLDPATGNVDMLQGLRAALHKAGMSTEQAEQLITQALQTSTEAGKKAALIRLAALAEALHTAQAEAGKTSDLTGLMDALAAQVQAHPKAMNLSSAQSLARILDRVDGLSAEDAPGVAAQTLSLGQEWAHAFEAVPNLDSLASYLQLDPLAVLAQAPTNTAVSGAATGTSTAAAGASAGAAALSTTTLLAIGGLAAVAIAGSGGSSATPPHGTPPRLWRPMPSSMTAAAPRPIRSPTPPR